MYSLQKGIGDSKNQAKMMKVMQANLNRSKTAQDLMAQLTFEKMVDVWILSEQYKCDTGPGWYSDRLGTAAIWIPDGRKVHVERHGRAEGFVWIGTGEVTYVSIYLTPNETKRAFLRKMDALEDKLRDMDGRIITAGDFNAKAVEWGMSQTDMRGRRVLEMAARLDLTILNTGNEHTFIRQGCRGTTPDITLATGSLVRNIAGWRVFEGFTGSDHQYISFSVERVLPNRQKSDRLMTSRPRWSVRKIDNNKLTDTIQEGATHIINKSYEGKAEYLVADAMKLLHQACDVAMPRITWRSNRRAVYWWTDEIASLRKECLRLRRRAQRVRRRNDPCQEQALYKAAKKRLSEAIRSSKARKWNEIIEEVDRDPWGRGYKIVKRGLGGLTPTGPMEPEKMKEIVDTLFPTHPIEDDASQVNLDYEIPLFTEGELKAAVNSMKNGKAPGMDGIPSEVLKISIQSNPGLFLKMYNKCLKQGIFPKIWKRQRLALISKGKGDPLLASSYRPLCMLDTAGKVMEKLLKPRLHEAINKVGGLSKNQHGFRQAHPCISAVR